MSVFLLLVLVKTVPHSSFVVNETSELDTILSYGAKQRELLVEVLDQTVEPLVLTRKVNHPRVSILQVSQCLLLKLVRNNANTLLHDILTNSGNCLPNNFFRETGRSRTAKKHCPSVQTGPIGKINGHVNQLLFAVLLPLPFPPIRGYLKEQSVSDSRF
ncbi:hypothetical protein V8G54_013945 [Vigna mungo]|uniref:Secreted protein n=1 Tax=Vigna mungo TaxID=3915 RepID=A0AAQ3NI62_VIGMU